VKARPISYLLSLGKVEGFHHSFLEGHHIIVLYFICTVFHLVSVFISLYVFIFVLLFIPYVLAVSYFASDVIILYNK